VDGWDRHAGAEFLEQRHSPDQAALSAWRRTQALDLGVTMGRSVC